ncbi:MAG: ABC transporter ATP-binding protein [Candidatus Hydrothermarchaeaceae archaeon]
MNILEVKYLKTHFFTRRGIVKAVDGISFDLKKGEVLCLVGESGSGKTVSALSILGLIDTPGRILEGEVLLDGENLREYTPEKLRRIRGRRIAMIFQDPIESLNPVLTIGDQISESMKIHLGLSDGEAREKAVHLLKRVGITSAKERLKSYPHEFSGGMNQRVMIAMALCCDPDILIADEPTSALDVTTQSQFLDRLMDLKKERGMSMIFITHDLGIVAEIADRIVVMYAGRAMERGNVWQIFESPRHPYTIGLLNCMPDVIGKRGKGLTPIPGLIPSLINPPSGCVFHPRCRFVRDMCSGVVPPEAKVEEGHFSACHFWDSEEVIKASEDVGVGR